MKNPKKFSVSQVSLIPHVSPNFFILFYFFYKKTKKVNALMHLFILFLNSYFYTPAR